MESWLAKSHPQERLQERPQTEVENGSHGAGGGLLFCWWIWWNSTIDHSSGALHCRGLHTPDFPPRRVTSAAAAFLQTDRSLREPWNNNGAFTSLQSLRPQGHNIWDRNRTGGSESSSTVEKVISHGCYCRIERHSFCHQPTTCQIKSEKSRFKMGSDVWVTSKCCLWTKTASLFFK